MSENTIVNQFKKNKVVVIIPTYNNEKTLKRVIDEVLAITSDIIVVNDGCTDGSKKIIENYTGLNTIHFNENKGKGAGLRAGFSKAIELGYNHAITIDSDGQHYASDIIGFLDTLEKSDEDLLIIGSRNMEQSTVPKKSSFGNKFSNFWFKVETGITLTDTQSGFRLYPLNAIKKASFFTEKFEFEIEVIVKLAWKGIKVINIPIKVLYDPDERVSHFRPLQDFTRISILNTYLVILTFLYIKPRDFFSSLVKKKFKDFIKEDLLTIGDSPLKKSLAIALGIFIGIAPFWGFQTVIVLFLASFLKLNRFIAFSFSNISIPPMIPIIILASIKIGYLMTGSEIDISYDFDYWVTHFKELKGLKEYLIGSFTLASISALVIGSVSFFMFNLSNRKKQ